MGGSSEQPLSILVVDSDESADLVAILGDLGGSARLVTDTAAALLEARRHPPAWVLVDRSIGEDLGTELLQELSREPTLLDARYALTCHDGLTREELERWQRAGVEGLFCRPFRPLELAARLWSAERVARQHRSLIGMTRALEEAQEIAGLGSWELDLTTTTPTWSKQMFRMTGLDAEARPPDWANHERYVHPDDWHELEQAFQALLGGGLYTGEYRIQQADGSYRWMRSRARPVCNADGTVVRLQGTTLDIHDAKCAEQAVRDSETRYRTLATSLKEKEAYFRSLFQGVPISLWEQDLSGVVDLLTDLGFQRGQDIEGYLRAHPEVVADCVGRFALIAVNDAAIALHKASSASELMAKVQGILTPRSLGAFGAHIAAVWRGATGWRAEVELQTLTGEPLQCLLYSAVPKEHRERFDRVFVSIVDMTDKSSLEAQLRQAQKMESIGRLAGGVAHDFNNLLTIILTFGNLVLDSLAERETPDANDVREILRAGERASELTRQLLAFSRKQAVVPRILDLNDELRSASKMLGRLIGEDIRLVLRLGTNVGPVNIDPGQLSQVLMNLAVNARDAMPTGGTLTIQTENVRATGAPARSPSATQVRVTISDTGKGMDPATIDQAFEPFFTTKPAEQGTGLGLSTVYGIVNQAGGSVDIESHLGKGTTVRVVLPTTYPSLSPSATTRPPRTDDQTATVLLVEDEPAVRAAAKRILSRAGYVILEATSPKDALRIAAEHPGAIDVLLTDVVMPEMNGTEVHEHVLKLRPDIKTLFMSGYTPEGIAQRGIDGRAILLQKPFSNEGLRRAVSNTLRRGD